MDQVHLHLLLSHLPIAGVIIGIIILAGGYVFKNFHVKRSALAIFVLSALFAIPVFLTGEGAEHTVEDIAGIEESYIETHEDLGKIYIWVVCGLGVLSLLTLLLDFKNNTAAKALYIVTLIASIATAAISKQLGTSGGEIRHTEIRTGTAQTPAPVSVPEKEEDEDH